MSVSEWVLALTFPPKRELFAQLARELGAGERRSISLAALHDFLDRLDADEFFHELEDAPPARLRSPDDAIVAAMVEHAASLKRAQRVHLRMASKASRRSGVRQSPTPDDARALSLIHISEPTRPY